MFRKNVNGNIDWVESALIRVEKRPGDVLHETT